MAKRYSGNLQINVAYDNRNFYRTSVGRAGKSLWQGTVGPVVRGIASDSPQAYDEVASAALSFADQEVRGLGDAAEYNEDGSGWLIRRTPRARSVTTASHATRKARTAPSQKMSPSFHERQTSHATRSKITIRKIEGRWQPVSASGIIVRGAIYNADGTGYRTRQGAEEAASMIRKLGRSA